jgi:hypothetical protein
MTFRAVESECSAAAADAAPLVCLALEIEGAPIESGVLKVMSVVMSEITRV